MSWMFWSRYEWMNWMIHHPWSFAIGPAVLFTFWTVQKIKER